MYRLTAFSTKLPRSAGFLGAHACDEAQGYYFSRPVPAPEFAKLLLVVFFAEYVAVDSTDARYLFATAILTVLVFIIFLILAVALKASNARLVLVAPALFLGSGLAALRTLHLRLNERWEYGGAIGVAVVITQVGAALHYMPLTPVRFGLALLGLAYALTMLAVSLAEGNPFRRAFVEPTVMLALLWGLMIWFR